jgi:hypothetical protein
MGPCQIAGLPFPRKTTGRRDAPVVRATGVGMHSPDEYWRRGCPPTAYCKTIGYGAPPCGFPPSDPTIRIFFGPFCGGSWEAAGAARLLFSAMPNLAARPLSREARKPPHLRGGVIPSTSARLAHPRVGPGAAAAQACLSARAATTRNVNGPANLLLYVMRSARCKARVAVARMKLLYLSPLRLARSYRSRHDRCGRLHCGESQPLDTRTKASAPLSQGQAALRP